MRIAVLKAAVMLLSVALVSIASLAQHAPAGCGHSRGPQDEQRPTAESQAIPAQISPESPLRNLPQLGAGPQKGEAPALTLEALERMALERNPTLAQAAAEIRGAQGRRRQAGLYPNPVIGYTGEEIRGGAGRGGQQGFFIEQDVVLGGKLGLSRRVAAQEISLAEIEAEEQRLRVVHSVRIAFYRALAAQAMLEAHRGMARVAADALETARRLRNIGQADETEVLQAEIEVQQAQLGAIRQENQFRTAWRVMAALAGDPGMRVGTLQGELEANLPTVNEEQVLDRLVDGSPAVRIAQVNVKRAEAELNRARRESIPDLRLRAGLQQNRELESAGRPVGLQGFAEIGVQVPLFNRNQGNVESTRAQRERAEQEVRRVQLVLYDRASSVLENYSSARATAERYREQVLPAARRAHELMLKQWGQMRASYPQLLLAQRTLFDVQTGYIASLQELWANAIALQGFLLTDGLEAPARPGEVDLPVREVNLPVTRTMER